MSKKCWLFLTVLTGVNALISLLLLTVQAPLNQWTRLSLFLYQTMMAVAFWIMFISAAAGEEARDE